MEEIKSNPRSVLCNIKIHQRLQEAKLQTLNTAHFHSFRTYNKVHGVDGVNKTPHQHCLKQFIANVRQAAWEKINESVVGYILS